ncbi:MAG: glutathione S-transferase family protein [Pseudomonadota bacterium]
MKTLYHYPLCPFSRQIRICFKELDINISLIKEDFWLRKPHFLKLNPAGELPILTELSGLVVAGVYPITEYLHEKYPTCDFMDPDPENACEIRRLLGWFNVKFYREVTKLILDEKLIRLLSNAGTPRTEYIRAAGANLVHHLKYMTTLLSSRGWLAQDRMTFADIAAASHLSVLDYFGQVSWDNYPEVKEWYSIIKSRPSFKPLLQDTAAGFTPPTHYTDLDF